MNILVLGATGTFGSRLCDRLLVHTDATLVVASRELGRAKKLADQLGDRTCPIAVELPAGIGMALDESKPDLVIDASGPFQGSDYAVPRAAATRGIHYLDLADARDCVAGICELNDLAQANGVVVLSGASSVPALSTAVVDCLAEGLERVDSIDMGITTAGGFALGKSVIQANLACAGLSIQVLRGGMWGEITGWLTQTRRTLRVDGMPQLSRRLFAPTEVPDLDLLPLRFPTVKTVLFRGGSELGVLQYGLAFLAGLRRIKVLSSFDWLAPLLTRLCHLFAPFGSGRSGMYVEVTGRDEGGQFVRRTWTIIADQGDGLYVPTLAAVALAKRMEMNKHPNTGARPAAGELVLDEFGPLFDGLTIGTEVRTEPLPAPVFVRGLGATFGTLPTAVQRLHLIHGIQVFEGKGTVERGRTVIARLAGIFLRLPPQMENRPLAVTIERRGGRERWDRNFDGHRFHSDLQTRRELGSGMFSERFGLVSGDLRLRLKDGRLKYQCDGFRMLGIPLPGFMVPRVSAYEEEDANGRFRFFVEIRLPWNALIVRYQGWLEIQ